MKLSKIYILLLFIILIAGCREEIKHRINFYHYLHVEEHEIECTLCHGEMTEGLFAPADMEICVECHEDEVDADEISRDTCGKCHLEKDLENIESHDYEIPTRGVFRHSEALNDSCRECHVDTVKEGSTKVAFWTRDDVIEIRNRAHSLGFDCQTCHENINKQTPWDNHKTDWIKRHRQFAEEENPVCTQCHSQENCRECHQQQAPSSHTNLWRLQTHGIEASWGRENCQVCHQNDFCSACHSSTRPRSHNSGWRSIHGLFSDLESCQVCHTTEACSYCHSITKPTSHISGWLTNLHCFNCHISESNCNVCHASSAGEIHDASAPLITQPFHAALATPNECLTTPGCHSPGSGGIFELNPALHFIFDESECRSCHQ